MKLKKSLLLISIFALSIACSDDTSDPVICTEIFVIFDVTIVDRNNLPVDSLSTSVVSKEGDFVYNFFDDFNGLGVYPVMTDQFKDELRGKQEVVIFTAENDSISVQQEFVFTADECHVNKLSGPDTLIIN